MRDNFFENVQNFIYISKMHKKYEKKFLFLQVGASELAALNCVY